MIETDAANGINPQLALHSVAEGGRTVAQISDAFGNPIIIADVTVTVNGADIASHPPVSMTGSLLTFSSSGDFVVEVALADYPAVSDSELVAVAPVEDTHPSQAAVTATFPTTTVPLQGFIEVTAVVSDNRALAYSIDERCLGRWQCLPRHRNPRRRFGRRLHRSGQRSDSRR